MGKLNYKLAFLVAFVLISNTICSFSSETYSIYGKITDDETGAPVPGATIRVENTSKGTYSSTNGKFRLPFLEGNASLKVSSVGYKSKIVKVSASSKDTIVIRLKPDDVKSKGVEVVGNIEVNEVIRRAVARKEENKKKIKTSEGLLYSKLVFELDGSLMNSASSDGGSIMLGGSIGGKKENVEKYKMFILETFSKKYHDFEKNVDFSTIIQRRQTANLQPQANLLTIGNFISFYDDEIKILNATMTTPLSRDALSYYDYQLLERSVIDDRVVYIIKVIPKSSLYPLFEGTIKLIEGTYELTEVDLKPSASTAISFINDLHINQKFSEIQKEAWVPSFLEVTGKAKVEIIKGLMDIGVIVNGTSIYSDMKINSPLPDSVYAGDRARITTVMPAADSAKTEFWEKNSLRDISDRELMMYKKVDSLVALDTAKKDSNNGIFGFNIMPAFDFNRVSSVELGINPTLYLWKFTIDTKGVFSFGLQKPLGAVSINYPLWLDNLSGLNIKGGVFSKVETSSNLKDYSRLVNALAAGIFHEDYYDYYRKDGWFTDLQYNTRFFSGDLTFENSRQSPLNITTNRSIAQNKPWRANPQIKPGNYYAGYLNASYGSILSAISENFQYKLILNSVIGKNSSISNGNTFKSIEGQLYLKIPTFNTGYSPMYLDLALRAGKASDDMPLQYQFRLPSRLVFLSEFGYFYSAPTAVYGGTEFHAAHATYNFTDIWWRAIGLPLYEGRGIELSIAGSAAKFSSGTNEGYVPTAPYYYSEVGFGLSRIPTFISNIGYLSFDARWGLGPLGAGRFGWGLSLSSPF